MIQQDKRQDKEPTVGCGHDLNRPVNRAPGDDTRESPHHGPPGEPGIRGFVQGDEGAPRRRTGPRPARRRHGLRSHSDRPHRPRRRPSRAETVRPGGCVSRRHVGRRPPCVDRPANRWSQCTITFIIIRSFNDSDPLRDVSPGPTEFTRCLRLSYRTLDRSVPRSSARKSPDVRDSVKRSFLVARRRSARSARRTPHPGSTRHRFAR